MSRWMGLLLTFSLVSFSSCGREPHKPDSAGKSALMALATREKIDGLTREQVAGRRIYRHDCLICHGETGHGNGFNTFNLKNSFGIEPADLTALDPPLGLEQLQQVISGGGPALGKSEYMPPWGGTLDASEIHAVATYVRTLSGQARGAEPAKSSIPGGR